MSDDYKGNTNSTGVVEVGGEIVSGQIETEGDNDWFAVELKANTSYLFQLDKVGQGGGINPIVELLNNNGRYLTANYDSGFDDNALISFTAPSSGTYWLDVSAYPYYGAQTGAYQLRAVEDQAGTTAASAGEVAVGGSVAGTLEAPGDVDWFEVSLTAGTPYRIELTGGDAAEGTALSASVVSVYGGRLPGLTRVDSEGGDGWVGSIMPELSGTFYVAVTASHAAASMRGLDFSLSLEEDDVPRNLVGSAGGDTLIGALGEDMLSGANGDDILTGLAGDDELAGGAGIDRVLEVFDGDLTLTDDQLIGLGADTLSGLERATLIGGAGDNQFDASGFSRGSVLLQGEAGDDLLIAPSTAGGRLPSSSSVLQGGEGDDTLRGGAGIDLVREAGDVDFILTDDSLTGLGQDQLEGIEFVFLSGGDGNNTLDASDFSGVTTVLEGGRGNDTLIGGGAHDQVRAISGEADLILTDTKLGTDKLDHIDSALLIANSYANVMNASAFTGALVRFHAGGYSNTYIGRADGLDRARVETSTNAQVVGNQVKTTTTHTLVDIDQLVIAGDADDNVIDVAAFAGRLTLLYGGAGDDKLIGGGTAVDRVVASGDVDFVLGNSSLTGLGTDQLKAIDQASLHGDSGENVIDASAFTRGRVWLSGEAGDDVLSGGTRGDRLSGGSGEDTLDGGSGTDRVRASGDLDFTLTDSLLTGLGTDTLISIEEAELSGGTGDNVLDASAFTGSLVIFEGLGGDDTLIGRAGATDRAVVRGDIDVVVTDAELTGHGTDSLIDIDELSLIGFSGDNRFDASAFTLGRVEISAGGGDDTLRGGTSGDRLDGGHGDDRLVGGAGKDLLTGGGGADRFALTDLADSGSTAPQRDVILDFAFGEGDTLDLSGLDGDIGLAGRQSFTVAEGASFGGSFSAPASLYFDTSTHILWGNVDGDSAADFSIELAGLDSLLFGLML